MCSDILDGYDGFLADVWAAGVCLYAFIYGALHVNEKLPSDEIFRQIREFELPPAIPSTGDAGLGALLRDILCSDPGQRPSVVDLLGSDCLCNELYRPGREDGALRDDPDDGELCLEDGAPFIF